VTGSPARRPEVDLLDDDAIAGLLPERDPRGHKGTHGRLLVVAGSLDYLGAALLASLAAARAGAGLVRLAVPASLQPLVAGRVLEIITLGLPEADTPGEVDAERALARLLEVEHDALVVGPGLRAGRPTVDLVQGLLALPGAGPCVVDAEALNSLAGTAGWPRRVRRPCVLTPHVGEFGRLWPDRATMDLVRDDDARAEAASSAARACRQVVVLKGARTVIASGSGSVARAPFENPALATGGTGDVLSGTIGALLAQGLAPFDAARAGVYLHGVAGDSIREHLGDAGLLASDLPEEVARARKRLARVRERRDGRHRMGFVLEKSRGQTAAGGRPAPADRDR
jgi:NAD(P)H-hydrate epimerase